MRPYDTPFRKSTRRPRILLVTPSSPHAPMNGTQQRTRLLYEGLSRTGEVDVLGVHQGANREHQEQQRGYSAQVCWQQDAVGWNKYRPDKNLTLEAETALQAKLEEYDLLVGRYLNPICKLQIPDAVPTLVDLDDLRYSHTARGTGLPVSFVTALKSRYAAALAERQLERFDEFFVLSKRDHQQQPGLLTEVLPNIPYRAPADPTPPADSTQLLFVGALWYGPNRDGIDRFLSKCWPQVHAALPEATLLLVGAASPRQRRDWSKHPGVSAPGYVDDLTEVYERSAAVIAPVYYGGGTNIKVLEAIAHRRPCITTPFCHEGLRDTFDGVSDLYVASTNEGFATACVDLLRAPDVALPRVDHALMRLSRHYTRERFVSTVEQTVARLLNQRRPTPCSHQRVTA